VLRGRLQTFVWPAGRLAARPLGAHFGLWLARSLGRPLRAQRAQNLNFPFEFHAATKASGAQWGRATWPTVGGFIGSSSRPLQGARPTICSAANAIDAANCASPQTGAAAATTTTTASSLGC